jgi:hypothetical protein
MDDKQQSRRAQGYHYVFGREQILTADLGVFGERYDPSHLTDEQLRPLFGTVSLELDWGERVGDAFVIPASRRFVKCLHLKRPWLGFFLAHAEPFGSRASLGQFPFLGLALCVSDLCLWANDVTGMARMEANQHQLSRFQNQLIFGLRHLGRRARLSLRVIVLRELEIRSQIARMLRPSIPDEGR